MGVSICLLFVRGRAISEVLDAVELATTEERRSTPVLKRGAFVAATLPSGYQLIWSNTCDEPRFSAAILAKLSASAEIVVLSVEEHVMFSHAELWQKGGSTSITCWP